MSPTRLLALRHIQPSRQRSIRADSRCAPRSETDNHQTNTAASNEAATLCLTPDLIFWRPEGTSTPTTDKGQRILNLFFEPLQGVASDRKISNNMCALSWLQQCSVLQPVAPRSTKVGSEQPPKTAIKNCTRESGLRQVRQRWRVQ